MIRRPPRSTRTTHSFPTRRSADALVPDLGGALIGGLWLGSFAVVGGRSFEHQRSPSERLTEEPPPWAPPDRTAWAVAWTAWVMLWERRMRCSQAGGPPALAETAEADARQAARSEERGGW